jgi:hypothetical protein
LFQYIRHSSRLFSFCASANYEELPAVNERWGISIDIEGLSANYEHSEERKTYAIRALGELMDAVYRIGSQCFPGTPEKNFSERLFAYQFGDGFLLCSDFPEPDASRAIAIAIAILRHLILKGFAAKAAIATGGLSGISGCYPEPMRSSKEDRLDMGMGLMTIISVMGTALTKAHKLSTTVKGAVLVVDKSLLENGLPTGIRTCGQLGNCVDWINSNCSLADEVADKSKLLKAGSDQLYAKLNEYCITKPVPPAPWVDGTFRGVGRNGA